MVKGQKVKLKSAKCSNVNGLPEIEFDSQPVKPEVFYHYKPPGPDKVGDQPIIEDEIAEDYVAVKTFDERKVMRIHSKRNVLIYFVLSLTRDKDWRPSKTLMLEH